MVRIIGYAIFLYLVLKLCRLLVTPAAADRDSRATLGSLIRAGEPMLFAGTFGLAVLIAIYTTWWTRQFAEGQYTYSADCYAKMAASHRLAGRPARFGSYGAAQAAGGHLKFAKIHGSQLGLRQEVIDRELDRARIAYSGYYNGLDANRSGRKIAAAFADLDRCLKGEGAPRGELLRPNL